MTWHRLWEYSMLSFLRVRHVLARKRLRTTMHGEGDSPRMEMELRRGRKKKKIMPRKQNIAFSRCKI